MSDEIRNEQAKQIIESELRKCLSGFINSPVNYSSDSIYNAVMETLDNLKNVYDTDPLPIIKVLIDQKEVNIEFFDPVNMEPISIFDWLVKQQVVLV